MTGVTVPDPVAVCGRCGYPKAEHKTVPGDDGDVLLCPTALYLKDQLQEIVNEP